MKPIYQSVEEFEAKHGKQKVSIHHALAGKIIEYRTDILGRVFPVYKAPSQRKPNKDERS